MKLPFLFLLVFSLNQGFSQVYHSIYTPMDIALNKSNYSNFYTYEDDHKNGILKESTFFKQRPIRFPRIRQNGIKLMREEHTSFLVL